MQRRTSVGLVLMALAALWTEIGIPRARAAEATVIVFAAASLTNVLEEVAAAHVQRGGARAIFSFAASSTAAKQIEQGSPAHIFISADREWMDYVEARNLTEPGTRRALAGNRLVLVVSVDRAQLLDLSPDGRWLAQLPEGRIAVGDPAHVPAGRYAEQAFRALGLWSRIEPRLARADNVRSALVLVERGEAAAGVVYGTDAALSKRVAIASVFPETTHAPIVYPMMLMRGTTTPDVRAFYDFLSTPAARAIFTRHGFSAP